MTWKTAMTSGWGRVLQAHSEIARPDRALALNALSTEGPAVGRRRSYGDAALNSNGRAIDMTRLDRMLGFDAATGDLTVEAGAMLGDIARAFAPRGWLPAVLPGTGYATVGGAIANDVHGKNHHQAGSFGCHVDSLELIGADGKLRRVSAERDADRFAATIGGLGLTGVIASARLRLAPCPSTHVEVEERRAADLDAFMEGFEASTHPFSVGWIDTTAQGRDLGRGILEEADFSRRALPPPRRKRGVGVPFDAPGFLLSRPVVRLFNRLYLARIPEGGRSRIRPLADFLFPLDRLRDWNRLYGKAGFFQFQCVLPDPARDVLAAMLTDVAASGLVSPLAVLKRMGPGRGGLMSFPMAGWTLALDFPNRTGARPLAERLERLTLEAGGRIYLAKDALTMPASIPHMYPELARFRDILAAIDPEGRFQTDLSRRLALRG
jgi:decaprenylphospho-beta-D-ribofuranose 2-oxidase